MKTKLSRFFIALLLCLAGNVTNSNVYAQLAGMGLEDDPYLISSVSDFQYFMKNSTVYANKYILLTTDLNVSSLYTPSDFSGHFDGGNHQLTSNQPIFSEVNGSVKNLLLNSSISLDQNSLREIGCLSNYFKGTIQNIRVSGTIEGDLGLISSIYSNVLYFYGGIVGVMYGGSTIKQCSFVGSIDVTGSFYGWSGEYGHYGMLSAGGLIGYAETNVDESIIISQCFTTGSINVLFNGGEQYYEDDYTQYGYKLKAYAGGIVGFDGRIKSNTDYNRPDGYIFISNCYIYAQTLQANARIPIYGKGNRIGYQHADLIGGTTGYTYENYRSKCYATSMNHINASFCAAAYKNNYVDGEKTGITESSTSKTTVEMKQTSTYETWNFDSIWGRRADINEGYPYLRWTQKERLENDGNISVNSISIDKDSCVLIADSTMQLIAKILPNSASNKGYTWFSTDTNIVKVNDGMITGISSGTAFVIAKTAERSLADTCVVTVIVPVKGISITNPIDNITLELGETATFTATVLPTNASNQNITWSSSNTTIAKIDNGIVTALSIGKTMITATSEDGSFTDSREVEVYVIPIETISLNKQNVTLSVGKSEKLTAIITPNNATDKTIIWTTDNEQVATIEDGLIKAVGAGTTIITAISADGTISTTCEVTVVVPVTAISLPESLEMTVGESTLLNYTLLPENATNKNITWFSSNNNIVTINNGIVTAISTGMAIITAITEDGNFTATCKINVRVPVETVTLNTTQLALNAGETYQLIAEVLPTNATDKTIIWSSSNDDIASVSASGLITAHSSGTATISATAEGKTATCVVTVSVPVTQIILSEQALQMEIGDTYQLQATVLPENATNQKITWTNSNPSAVYLSNGLVVAVGDGVSILIVTTEDGGHTATCKVTVGHVSTNVEYQEARNRSTVYKVFENGTIYILRNGERYTIDGRKVE